jgi:general secretion pathway protein G
MIEMMVVLIIIAVLIGVGVRFYTGYIEGAKVTKARSQISTMQGALDAYYSENAVYPDTTNKLKEAGLITGKGTDDNDIGDDQDVDLKSTDAAEGVAVYDPWGKIYQYRKKSDETTYCISTGYDKVQGDKEVIGQGKNGSSTSPKLGTAALP